MKVIVLWDSGGRERDLVLKQENLFIFIFYFYYTLSSRVHVHNVQVCYICIYVPCWCAAPINSSFTLGIPPNAIPPPYPLPTIGPGVWCSPSCVQVISLFNSHLWVRTYGVWFSVLATVCWEWWFLAPSSFLIFYVETGSPYVAQTGLELLASTDPPTSAFEKLGLQE